ncbi:MULTISPECIES: DUF397 domain-containing protein [Streptomyces]|uniref:DUF397 domain-containing protein n=1 Tax=Streptomyces venezuelae TaxID=54571 RepID=A0A5P2BED8_STRVZ|nr:MULTISPECIES: DUF397 domain-containing protein [Streptomyces]NDZ98202.1 DUF397 domain-containing protein [Streptomyces sp. SID10116]MYY83592.1 DUF397 domain-containing protein [Streptomyces sp. SID335]MYZ16283.1 DUF397 domain-containing protein [Streptomyces sp. SID337]NDZ87733.1 DUF397 domain-containing protein [Streptomyces sp. SID10115]NEB47154.1 DUF397 domain-containing protein [Streptomyces sp. SID339]
MNRQVSAEGSAELEWRKSSYSSNGSEADCVEAAEINDLVHVRDSKNTQGPILTVQGAAWSHFVRYASGS